MPTPARTRVPRIPLTQRGGRDEGSEPNLTRRQQIAKVADGYIGSEQWLFDVQKGSFGVGTYKCNKFVCDVLEEAGAPAKVRDGLWSCPTAGELGDPKVSIPGWRVLRADEAPEPGDIIAYQFKFSDASGHSGVIGSNGPVSSHDHSPVDNQFPVKDGATVVIRRYGGR